MCPWLGFRRGGGVGEGGGLFFGPEIQQTTKLGWTATHTLAEAPPPRSHKNKPTELFSVLDVGVFFCLQMSHGASELFFFFYLPGSMFSAVFT